MKASEVLRRYAAGERDFRRTNLRGQSFKGQDLSGADFSGADIRGANFTDATLKESNFTDAKAGIQKRWWWLQQGLTFLLSILASLAATSLGSTIAIIFFDNYGNSGEQALFVIGAAVLGLITVACIPIARQGFTSKTLGTISTFFAISYAIVFAIAFAFAHNIPTAISFAFFLVVIVAFAFALSFAIIFVFAFAISITHAVSVALAIVCVGAVTHYALPNDATALSFGISAAFGSLLFAVYCSRRTLQGDERFAILRSFRATFGGIGGTSFRGATLTRTNFSRAVLKRTNFNHTSQKQTILGGAYWRSAQNLDLAQLDKTYLEDPKIRQLVITLNGQDQNYDGLNLEGVNLQGANLQDSSFIGTNLNYASLQDANLSRAILKQTQLDETDLTGATLTGAYIEDWGITGTTKLNGVQCDYIFMRVPTKDNPVPLRKPDNQREMFANGGFADFIQPYVDTLDLYHSQDVDPRAISIAFKKLSQNHPDADLEIVAMEKRGQNSLNLKVRTAATADKSELSAEYFADYNQLKALSETRLLLLTEKDDRIRSLEQMIQTALYQPTFNVETVQGDFMPENSGINISAGGSVGDISGLVGGDVSGVVNLGTISGNVTNAINQLPETSNPDQPDLKQLLMQLQEAIETDADLPDIDKADLLEQVQNLAEAKQTEEPAQKEGLARKARKMFEATLKSLPDTAKIVEASSKLLPLILKALGLSV